MSFIETTELLTNNGWKLFQNLSKKDKIATLSDNSQLVYQKYYNFSCEEYRGTIHRYKSRDIDLCITPSHNLYYKPRYRANWEKNNIEDIKTKYFHMKKDAMWSGTTRDYYCVGDNKISYNLWLEFLGYFLSEGYCSKRTFLRKPRNKKIKYERFEIRHMKDAKTGKFITNTSKKEIVNKIYKNKQCLETKYVVGICQSKLENISIIDTCLKQMPFKFNRCGEVWYCASKILYEILSVFGKSNEKFIPDYIKSSSSEQIKIFYEAMMLGDGTVTKCNNSYKRTYYTSSKKLADDFQEILLKIGYCGDITFSDRIGRKNKNGITRHIEWRVGIKIHEKTPSPGNGWHYTISYYSGNVYNIFLQNDLIYIRNNGKSVWAVSS